MIEQKPESVMLIEELMELIKEGEEVMMEKWEEKFGGVVMNWFFVY
jgi:hypothetical protein